MSPAEASWPAHDALVVPWRVSGRGPRDDRMVREITTSIPPTLAELDLRTSAATELAVADASAAIAALDAGPGAQLAGLGSFLLRTESVASSKIERINSSRNDFAKAVAGIRSTSDAKFTLAAASALEEMIRRAGETGTIELPAILEAHRLLLESDPGERAYAGRLRDVQNWIGGSDYSPRNAIHVPPPPEQVPALMEDLLTYSNRHDLPAITQAAIAHAQFESIHPFTDGNGRIGRALISAILRRRGMTTNTVVPIASAMLADTGRYFRLVNDYRRGSADEFVNYVARSGVAAAGAAQVSARVLRDLPTAWRDAAKPRGGSTDAKLLDLLLAHPVVTVQDVVRLTGASHQAAGAACERLAAAEVLIPLTTSRRDRAWMAVAVLDEIDEMNRRIGQRQVTDLPTSG